MAYEKGDIVEVVGFSYPQVITQDQEGDQIDVIEDGEYGSVDASGSSYEDGIVRNIISESDIKNKIDETTLQ